MRLDKNYAVRSMYIVEWERPESLRLEEKHTFGGNLITISHHLQDFFFSQALSNMGAAVDQLSGCNIGGALITRFL